MSEYPNAQLDSLVQEMDAASKALRKAAETIEAEALWLDRNWPLRTWSVQTATNYLRAARAQAEVETERAFAEASRALAPLPSEEDDAR